MYAWSTSVHMQNNLQACSQSRLTACPLNMIIKCALHTEEACGASGITLHTSSQLSLCIFRAWSVQPVCLKVLVPLNDRVQLQIQMLFKFRILYILCILLSGSGLLIQQGLETCSLCTTLNMRISVSLNHQVVWVEQDSTSALGNELEAIFRMRILCQSPILNQQQQSCADIRSGNC